MAAPSSPSPSMLKGAVVPLLLCALLAVPWDWTGVVKYGRDAIVHDDTQPPDAHQPLITAAYKRTTLTFSSHGEKLEAWAYVPRGTSSSPKPTPVSSSAADRPAASTAAAGSPPSAEGQTGLVRPCLIMAHGLGGQRDFGLHRFAEVFVKEGYAALVFDYRCFGGSTGEPRNWISPSRHVEDWVSAIHSLQPGGEVTSSLGLTCSSLALWGTSFSGGHVLAAAAKVSPQVNISAVVSQIPHLSGFEASLSGMRLRGVLGTLRMLGLGLHDIVRSKLGLPAAYIKIVGRPSEAAFMLLEEAEEKGYYAKHPPIKRGGWTPWAPARLALEISRYSPMRHISKIKCPVLFVAASKDLLCPARVVRQVAGSCAEGQCRLVEVDVDHFNVYAGMAFLTVTEETIAFLRQHAV